MQIAAALTKISSPHRAFASFGDRVLPFDALDDLANGEAFAEPVHDRIAELMRGGYNSRKTFAGRLSKIDDAILRLIKQRFDPTTRVRIHDAAASNAITSVALFNRVQELTNVSVIASDLHKEILVVTPYNSQWRVIFDDAGEWIQAVCESVVVSRQMRTKEWHPLNVILAVFVQQMIVPRAVAHLRKHPNQARRVALFHPVARKLAAKDSSRFALAKYDILNLPEASSEIVRAVNVLSNLPCVKRHLALRSLCRSLVDGGLLVIGYGGKRCSIFAREGERMRFIEDVGKQAWEKLEVLQIRELHGSPPTG